MEEINETVKALGSYNPKGSSMDEDDTHMFAGQPSPIS
jgi:hypothetical protein